MNDIAALRDALSRATPGPWQAKAMGGSSTVLCEHKPPRNDTRIPPYAYREEHCLAYPFIEEDGAAFRKDFVCFGHDDARFIELARSALGPLCDEVERLREAIARALKCTPSIGRRYVGLNGMTHRDVIQYDCGDPWEILRAALGGHHA